MAVAARCSALSRRLALRARGTTVQREVLGGVATFLTMTSIVFVNPAILCRAHPLRWAIVPLFIAFFLSEWLDRSVV